MIKGDKSNSFSVYLTISISYLSFRIYLSIYDILSIYLVQDSDDDDVEEEIDAKIEQMLSAKRTVKNIDAASMANLSGQYLLLINKLFILLFY